MCGTLLVQPFPLGPPLPRTTPFGAISNPFVMSAIASSEMGAARSERPEDRLSLDKLQREIDSFTTQVRGRGRGKGDWSWFCVVPTPANIRFITRVVYFRGRIYNVLRQW